MFEFAADRDTTPEQSATLAFGLFRFYEDAAERTRTRAWTLSVWIYSVNSLLLMLFGYSIATNLLSGFPVLSALISASGFILSGVSILYIFRQGKDIKEIRDAQNTVIKLSPGIAHMIRTPRATFINEFRFLILVSMLYGSGFAIAYLVAV